MQRTTGHPTHPAGATTLRDFINELSIMGRRANNPIIVEAAVESGMKVTWDALR